MSWLWLLLLPLAAGATSTPKNKTVISTKLELANLAGHKIIFIGDSLSLKGGPGNFLCDLLEASGATVYRDAVGGRSTSTFILGSAKLKDKGLTKEEMQASITSKDIDTVVIMLGTNHNPEAPSNSKYVRKMLDGYAKASIVWVGPPSFRTGHKYGSTTIDKTAPLVANMLDSTVSNFVDAQPITEDMIDVAHRKDGIHFSKGAKTFAERLYPLVVAYVN